MSRGITTTRRSSTDLQHVVRLVGLYHVANPAGASYRTEQCPVSRFVTALRQVLVQKVEAAVATKSGILLADSAKEAVSTGKARARERRGHRIAVFCQRGRQALRNEVRTDE